MAIMYRWTAFAFVLQWLILSYGIAETRSGLPLSEVEGEPSSWIAGCVNAISGCYSEQSLDIALNGVEPILFSSIYNSSSWKGGYLADGWGHSYPFWCVLDVGRDKYCTMTLPQASGSQPVFQGNRKARQAHKFPKDLCTFTFHSEFLERGLTNCSSGCISGRTNLKTTTLQLVPSGQVVAKQGDGTQRHFTPLYEKHGKTIPSEWFLRTEVRPSGNRLHYEYLGRILRKVKTTSADGKVLNWIEFDATRPDQLHIRTSEGKTISYLKQQLSFHFDIDDPPDRYRIGEVHRPDAPTVRYRYGSGISEKVIRRELPNGRYQEVSYYGYDKNRVGDSIVHLRPFKDDWLLGRVSELRAPVGCDATPVRTHSFFYSKEAATEVRDAHNHRSLYHYCTSQRLTEIGRYTGTSPASYVLYSSERFYWGDQSSIYRSDLVAKALADGQGTLRSLRTLQYDGNHNVVAETLYGNLSGSSTVLPEVSAAGIPQPNDCEHYTTHYTYSEDGFNLLTSEREENGRLTSYSYKPGTDLLISKLMSDGKRILTREFHEYNSDGVRVRTTVDDGCGLTSDELAGVTVRRAVIAHPRLEGMGIGLPESVECNYLDLTSGIEKLLSRQVNCYNPDLRLVRQEHYDSDSQLRYVLTWEYDAMGNVIREADALGQQTVRRYDANGNKVFEQGPRSGVHTEWVYDYTDRCIRQERVYSDGTRRATTYRYDTLSQKIAEVDHMGRETRFVYDDLGRLIETQLPEVVDAQGKLCSPTIRQEYDIAGNVAAIIDANGITTRVQHNMRGQITQTTYPDGRTERCVYDLDGTLQSSVASNGLTTRFTYDVLGHCVRKEMFSSSGESLAVTTSTFSGDRILSETDAQGTITHYEYDGAGRQFAVSKGDTRTEQEYDSLGRRAVLREWVDADPSHCKITRTAYDLLNRVVDERIETASGHLLKRISYAYDAAGNRTHVTEYPQGGPATTVTEYDLDGRPVRVTDPLGYSTVTEYDDRVCDGQGRRVLQIRTTDPLGIQTWTTQDVLGRVVEELRKDVMGVVVARSDRTYDPIGNLVRSVQHRLAPGMPAEQIVTEWLLDTCNRPLALREAVGTTDERETRYHFNEWGQQEALVLPDGLHLRFAYDDWGRLTSYQSDDRSFAYEYRYDLNGNVTDIDELVSATTTHREYDACNRMTKEVLAHGVSIGITYDGLGRTQELHLPDGSVVDYGYDALYLRQVTRRDQNRQEQYTHRYADYDTSGNLMAMDLIGAVGRVTYARDALSRLITLVSPYFQEFIGPHGYDAAGNLVARRIRDVLGEVDCQYRYDALHQLTQESGLAQHQYTHDSLYNRLRRDLQVYTVNARNELVQTGDTHYQYNERGCRLSQESPDGWIRYEYDALNRLTMVETQTERVVYTYDSCNRRLSTTSFTSGYWGWYQTSCKRFLYNGQDEIGAVDDSGRLTELRVLGRGRGAEIDATVAIELAGAVYAPICDSAGNIVSLVNAYSGSLAEGYRFGAFGEETIYGGWGYVRSSSPVGNPWRFSSKRTDPETGLVNYGRRYYDPSVGRWLTTDPLGYKAGPNLYAYVNNSPLAHFDLYGLLTRTRQSQHAQMPAVQRSARLLRERPVVRHLRWLAGLPGRMSESIGRHCVPIPVIRDSLMMIGRALQARPLRGCEMCREYPSHSDFVGGEELSANVRTIVCNGICNGREDARQLAQDVSHTQGGTRVHYTYSSSRGFMLDLMESAALKLGIVTPAVRELASNCKARLQEMDLEGRVSLRSHSQGGQVAWVARKLLSDAERSRIDVITFGSAKIIPDNTFGSALNYMSTRDAVPLIASPIDYARARLGYLPNVHFVESGEGFFGFDHAIRGKTYGKMLGVVSMRHMTEYGEE